MQEEPDQTLYKVQELDSHSSTEHVKNTKGFMNFALWVFVNSKKIFGDSS